MTPHNTNDWDPELVDAEFRGKPRKLRLPANRNGFFYVLDRLTGEFLSGSAFIHNLTWTAASIRRSPDHQGDPVPTYEPFRSATLIIHVS